MMDPSQNFLDFPEHPLTALFHPQKIALIGATEKLPSVGRTLFENLQTFKGAVYPINPNRETVLGKKCYPSLAAINEPLDLAIIATPAATVPELIKECIRAQVKTAIVISAGFKEMGAQGAVLEQEIKNILKTGSLRLIGPNCLGVQNPWSHLNATFAASMALPGSIAFISQSGAMCTSVLDGSLKAQIGFSAFVSIGSMADIDWGDLIDYFGNDPHTESILIYMETIGNPRSFLSAAKEVALSKPIIVIKAGRTKAAALAAASHTGSLAGSDEVFDAAMRRVGVLRVDTIEELFDMARLISKQPRPEGPRLAIVTNAGGPAVLATDAASLAGATIATLKPATLEALDSFLPAAWSHQNPVDILGDADATTYAKALDIVAHDENTDGLLAILSPQDMTRPDEVAKAITSLKLPPKPLLASWMGGKRVEKGAQILQEAGIATFSFPDNAARLFARMWDHSRRLSALYETPRSTLDILSFDEHRKRQEEAEKIFAPARQEGRFLLTEAESKKLLLLYGINTVITEYAKTAEEALQLARKIGFPVVLKLHSRTITHKSDVGGVQLNLQDDESVIKAFKDIQKGSPTGFEGVTVQPMIKHDGYELILGSTVDEQFGPTILFGLGGQLVEIFKDKALTLPPLTSTLAKHLMQETRIYNALLGVRGKPAVDMQALENTLVSFSHMIADLPSIKECDINPLLVSAQQIIALDARVVLQKEPLPTLAIRPYPVQYVSSVQIAGETMAIRPIRPEDEPLVVQFHKALSEESVRKRYLGSLSLDERIRHQRLIRLCCSDYDRDIALIALLGNKIVGIARLMRLPGISEASFALTVIDSMQNKGIGKELFKSLIKVAKEEKIAVLHAAILKDNKAMLHLCEKEGFTLSQTADIVQGQLLLQHK